MYNRIPLCIFLVRYSERLWSDFKSCKNRLVIRFPKERNAISFIFSMEDVNDFTIYKMKIPE
jgi:hypothetical protein